MKTKNVIRTIFIMVLAQLFSYCTKKDFPVPPASTVPLFTYEIDNDGFAPATVTFENISIVPTEAGVPSYFWNFGDGSSSTEIHPVHFFENPATFEVKLVITTSVSLEIKELVKEVVIKDPSASGVQVFFTDGSLVYTGLVNSSEPVFTTLNIGPFSDSYGLEVDTVNMKLYISDFDASAIYQCDLDGNNLIEFRTNLLGPDGLEIDYQENQLYWDTDNGIQRASLLSSDVTQIEDFVTGQSNDPEGVSIDPVNRKLYWVNYNGGLWCKNLDGTAETELIAEPEGGATLVVGNKIFFDQWIATGDIHLKSANLDGTGVAIITTGISKVIFGLGYEASTNKIYWGDRSKGKIMCADLDGANIETWYESEGSSPRGIVFGNKK